MEDEDNDGLTVKQELAAGTDINRTDTDGGGVNDGQEVMVDKTNPLDSSDDGQVVRLCPESIGVGQTVTVGLKSLPTSRSRLEQLRLTVDMLDLVAGSISVECVDEVPAVSTSASATPGFADIVFAGVVAITVATNAQWDLINLIDNTQIDFSHYHEMSYYQAVLLMVSTQLLANSTVPYYSALLALGVAQPGALSFATGGASFYDASSKSYSSSMLVQDTYDAQSIGGGYRTSGAVIANANSVDFRSVSGDVSETLIELSELSDIVTPAYGNGEEILSAYRQTENGPLLVLTSKNLYSVNPVTKASQAFAGVGLPQSVTGPRQLRCRASICVVSHFGGQREDGTTDPGGITIVNWSGTGDITDGTVITTVPLGSEAAPSGVVGVSLMDDGRGNVAIAAAGFSSGELYELVVENGAVTRSLSQTVPEGCLNPGHVQQLVDPEGLKLIATCFNSSNYVVTRSLLQ